MILKENKIPSKLRRYANLFITRSPITQHNAGDRIQITTILPKSPSLCSPQLALHFPPSSASMPSAA